MKLFFNKKVELFSVSFLLISLTVLISGIILSCNFDHQKGKIKTVLILGNSIVLQTDGEIAWASPVWIDP